VNGDVLTIGTVAVIVAAGWMRRGSRQALADLSGYDSSSDLPPDLPLLRLPDGTVLTGSSLLDVWDESIDSEFSWLLFLDEKGRKAEGATAQRNLERVAAWLETVRPPVTVWRGLLVAQKEPVRFQRENLHWTPIREIALDFAYGSDHGGYRPETVPAKHRPVLLRSEVRNVDEVDWITSVYWFLGGGGTEKELYLTAKGARTVSERGIRYQVSGFSG